LPYGRTPGRSPALLRTTSAPSAHNRQINPGQPFRPDQSLRSHPFRYSADSPRNSETRATRDLTGACSTSWKSRPGRSRRQGLPGQHLGDGPDKGKGKSKPEPQKEANRAHAKLRAVGERANAQLKTWDILDKLRCCPWKACQRSADSRRISSMRRLSGQPHERIAASSADGRSRRPGRDDGSIRLSAPVGE
jgi:hypothetical protein